MKPAIAKDNREHLRISYEMNIEVVLEGVIKEMGKLSNLCSAGALVQTDLPLSTGENVAILINLPGITKCCEIPCIVRWVQEGEGAGLQFKRLSSAEAEAIGALTNSHNVSTN